MDINETIKQAQTEFRDLLSTKIGLQGASIEQYARFLAMQYHLTKEVARYFFMCAAHPAMARKKGLRRFLTSFALEEELHYLVAARDLRALSLDIMAEPLDVRLWHLFFKSVVEERPFLRIGAAAVLENISSGPAREATMSALRAPFMTKHNTKFLVLHQHERIQHGEQILEALGLDDHSAGEWADLCTGAAIGKIMYLRMAEWALTGGGILLASREYGHDSCTIGDAHRLSQIEEEDMAEVAELIVGDQATLLVSD